MLTSDCDGNAPVLRVIEGMAGVGKTALAVHVAHHMTARYPDAQLFLPFPEEGPGATAEALHRLLRMLGIPAVRIPAEIGERAKLWRAEVAHRRMVVVLDDAPGPDEVAPIMPAVGDSLLIATSRQHADWPGLRVLRLEPLGARDSATLLRRLVGPVTDYDTEKVAQVASLSGGLPLAIRVAAGRLREGDLDDLDSLISELTDIHAGRADDTEVGRRIFSAFEFTYRQLTARHKRLFRLLGATPSVDLGLDAAAALTGETRESAAEGIRALCERYLLEHAAADRFRFHGLIRSYAAACCVQEEPRSERRRAIDRLIQYYSDTLSAATAEDRESFRHGSGDPDSTAHDGTQSQFPDADSAHAWLEAEWRNVLLMARHAAGHERHRQCADLTHSLAGFLHTGGYWSDAVAAHEVALHASRLLSDPARTGAAALDLAAACRRTGDYERPGAARPRLSPLTSRSATSEARPPPWTSLASFTGAWGEAREALAHHQEAADLYHAAGDPVRHGDSRHAHGDGARIAWPLRRGNSRSRPGSDPVPAGERPAR